MRRGVGGGYSVTFLLGATLTLWQTTFSCILQPYSSLDTNSLPYPRLTTFQNRYHCRSQPLFKLLLKISGPNLSDLYPLYQTKLLESYTLQSSTYPWNSMGVPPAPFSLSPGPSIISASRKNSSCGNPVYNFLR